MDSIRVSAKTVEDALTEASIQLGTSSDNIEYTVIDEGTKGLLFGLGGRDAVIEAKRKMTDEDLMKEIFEEEPSKEQKKETLREEKQEKRENKEEKETLKEYKKDNKKEVRKETKDTKPEAAAKGAKPAESGKEASSQNGPKEGKKPKEVKELKDTKEQKNTKEARETKEQKEPKQPKQPKTPADPEEAKRRAISFLREVLDAMDMSSGVTAEFEDGTLCVNIEGENMGILIGKRGQTLDSLQYLTSLVVNKGKSSYVRVKLDTEDYRNRRKATLENLAKNIAVKVKKTGRPVFLEPMNPYERRIIHSALQSDPYVTTHSEGEEPYRKVVVTLKKDHEKGHGYSRYEGSKNAPYDSPESEIEEGKSASAESSRTAGTEEE